MQQFTTDEVLNGTATRLRQERLGPDQGGRCVRFHDARRRRHEPLGNDEVGDALAAAGARADGAAEEPAAQLRDAVRPDGVRLQSVLPAVSDVGRDLVGEGAEPRLSIYGVTGTTTVLGVQKVKVPAGTFQALVVRTKLKQEGFPFGSGTRTMWFAPGKGLVKLVFKHGDGSVSTVDRLR